MAGLRKALVVMIASGLWTSAHAQTRYGYHLHTYPTSGFNHFTQFQQQLKITGGKAGRIDTYWPGFQSEPQIPFNPNANKMSEAKFKAYLAGRGYGEDGANLFSAYSDLHDALVIGVRPIFNFGVVPEWAYQPESRFRTWISGNAHEFTYHPTPEQIKTLRENSMNKPELVGEFLSDLAVYIARKPSGMAVLKNLGGWEIFNEVGTMYGNGTPPEPGTKDPATAWTQLPFTDYLGAIDATIAYLNTTYQKLGLVDGPQVIAPPVGGTYNPAFWQAIGDYRSKFTKGKFPLQQVGLHPYGMTVQAWLEPYTIYHKPLEDGPNNVRTNMSYGRVLMPTDDRFTWESLVARAQATPFKDRLYLYATRNNNADAYFDTNTEMGVTRTMARFAQMGYGKINVNFSEFGASSYVGAPTSTPNFTQINTTFADPFKYGEVPSDLTLTKDIAENTQSETVLQTLGLMRNWDFVNTATIYEMFEKPLPLGADRDEYQYGLAAPAMSESGIAKWKPAGLLYNAFLQGHELHQLHAHGVDLHLSAADGSFDQSQINRDTHNVVLFNDAKSHSLTLGAGDDIIFGGTGDDFLVSGDGNNRLYGGFGNDILLGGAGDDKIAGGGGDDLMTGGTGKSEFVFAAYATEGSGFDGHDTVTDFKPGDVLTIVGGFAFEKMQMEQTSEGGVKGIKIIYASNGASIFLQGATRDQLQPASFHVLEAEPPK
jgi:RTX calcium-binding nonapeptide repeat (4 copies)